VSPARQRPDVELLRLLTTLVDEIAQSTHEPVDGCLVVGERDQWHQPAVIHQFHIDLALVSQPIVRLITGETDGGSLDHHVRRPARIIRAC
jgi:hypothetical protein